MGVGFTARISSEVFQRPAASFTTLDFGLTLGFGAALVLFGAALKLFEFRELTQNYRLTLANAQARALADLKHAHSVEAKTVNDQPHVG